MVRRYLSLAVVCPITVGYGRVAAKIRRLGRPPMPKFKVERIRDALAEGRGVRETARLLKVSAAKVVEVRRAMSATAGPHAAA